MEQEQIQFIQYSWKHIQIKAGSLQLQMLHRLTVSLHIQSNQTLSQNIVQILDEITI